MKPLLRILFLVFLLPAVTAQSQEFLSAGKMSVVNRSSGGKILLKQSHPLTASSSSPKPQKSQGPFHVTFHFDTAPYDLLFNSADTSYAVGDLYWAGPTTAEIWMEQGTYDLLFFFQVYAYPSYIFKKDFAVFQDKDTTILMSSANHTLTFNLFDENNTLITASNLDGDDFGLIFEFPDDFFVPYKGSLIVGWGVPYAKFNDIPPEIRITAGCSAVKKKEETGDNRIRRYVTTYPIQQGIAAGKVLNNDPADYGLYPQVFYPSVSASDSYWGFGFGYASRRTPQLSDYLVVMISNNEYPSVPVDTILLYSSQLASDSSKAILVSGIAHWENSPLNLTVPDQFTDSWMTCQAQNKDLVLSATGTFPPDAADYRIGNCNTAAFGNTAPFMVNWFVNQPYGISLFESFTGQENEYRALDQAMSVYEIWKGSQRLVRDTVRTASVFYPVNSGGIYSLVINDSNYSLPGKPGFLQVESSFDLSKSDRNPPTVTAFRVLKIDSVNPELIHGFDASVAFSAGDFTLQPTPRPRKFHGLASIHLFYKDYDGLTWTELPVAIQPSLFDSLNGNFYLADLLPVMNQFPDSAWIDLKLELADSAGNTTVQIQHPAFLVRDAMVGIAGERPGPPMRLFPDPAADILHVESPFPITSLEVLSLSGAYIITSSHTREIDLSSLPAGIYFLRATGAAPGLSATRKFVKR
jgi:hypothetical protein